MDGLTKKARERKQGSDFLITVSCIFIDVMVDIRETPAMEKSCDDFVKRVALFSKELLLYTYQRVLQDEKCKFLNLGGVHLAMRKSIHE